MRTRRGGGSGEGGRRGGPARYAVLRPRERAAALELVRRVRERVPAQLARAFVFGSKARGEARPDSDVDVLLVWRRLPPDREPQAGMAEDVAEEVAADTQVPVTVWSVSLPDLEAGFRTPMLVDALDDGIPLWPPGAPRCPLPFTPADALRCAGSLLARVREGGEEASGHLLDGDRGAAWKRMRDDLVRLCTAGLLLAGETRPRRGDAVRRFLARRGGEIPGRFAPLFRWAAESYGPAGRDDDAPVARPPGGTGEAAALIDLLRRRVAGWGDALAGRLAAGNPPRAPK
ncbi:MAG TPA: nucleotidyltransferase domain-containing protein [Longimicrobiaceae bacterium]